MVFFQPPMTRIYKIFFSCYVLGMASPNYASTHWQPWFISKQQQNHLVNCSDILPTLPAQPLQQQSYHKSTLLVSIIQQPRKAKNEIQALWHKTKERRSCCKNTSTSSLISSMLSVTTFLQYCIMVQQIISQHKWYVNNFTWVLRLTST